MVKGHCQRISYPDFLHDLLCHFLHQPLELPSTHHLVLKENKVIKYIYCIKIDGLTHIWMN